MSKFTQTGNETELYVLNIMKEFKEIENVRRTNYCSKIDILFNTLSDKKLRGIQIKTLRGIQIKTLSKIKDRIQNYGCAKMNGYPDDMIIICLNIENEKCVILKGKDTK